MAVFKNNQFTLILEGGTLQTFDVLFTYDDEKTGKSYVVYTDNTKDEAGNINVYASSYDPTGKNTQLMPIETEKEWKIIEIMLDTIQETVQESIRNSQSAE